LHRFKLYNGEEGLVLPANTCSSTITSTILGSLKYIVCARWRLEYRHYSNDKIPLIIATRIVTLKFGSSIYARGL
jgi:hypothetical protein